MNDEILLRVLSGRASAAERAEVLAWRKRGEAREQRYRELAGILGLTIDAHAKRTPGPRPSVEEVMAKALDREEVSRVERKPVLGHLEAAATWLRDRRLPLAAAAVVVLLLLLVPPGRLRVPAEEERPVPFGTQEFVTGPDETATLVLNDGTVVRLDERSRLRVLEVPAGRQISLSGRAYFAVAHDEDQPFTVRTGAGEVEVLGTRFVLEASAEDLELVVVEGQVALTTEGRHVELGAQQMGKVMRGTTLPVANVPDPNSAVGWVGNFLAFQDTPLLDAAREIESKYDIGIEILDPTLGDRTITAWFADWSSQEVIEAVCIVVGAHCDMLESVVTMQAGP